MHSALRVEDLALQAQALHRTVHYENGRSCPEESSPSCLAPLGSIHYGNAPHGSAKITHPTPKPAAPTALSRRAERDPATPNPVTVTPHAGGRHTVFVLSFRALLNGGGYSYDIQAEGARRVSAQRNGPEAGRCGDRRHTDRPRPTITKTFKPPPKGLCPGRYRVYVAYDNPESQLQNYPFATVRFLVAG